MPRCKSFYEEQKTKENEYKKQCKEIILKLENEVESDIVLQEQKVGEKVE